MSDKPISARISPPKRVEILKSGDKGILGSYWKPGQFGYAISYNTYPGTMTESGPSNPGELSYAVTKSKSGRGGARWFSADALRFTTKAPRDLTADLPDEEKIAVDLLLQGGGATDRLLMELVPDADRRGYIKSLAVELRSLRAR